MSSSFRILYSIDLNNLLNSEKCLKILLSDGYYYLYLYWKNKHVHKWVSWNNLTLSPLYLKFRRLNYRNRSNKETNHIQKFNIRPIRVNSWFRDEIPTRNAFKSSFILAELTRTLKLISKPYTRSRDGWTPSTRPDLKVPPKLHLISHLADRWNYSSHLPEQLITGLWK